MPLGQTTRHSEALQLVKALEDLSLPVKQILLNSGENEKELEYLVSEQELSERLEWLFLDREVANMLRQLIQRINDNQIVPLKQSSEEKYQSLKTDTHSKEESLWGTNKREKIQKRQVSLQLFEERVKELEKKKKHLEYFSSVARESSAFLLSSANSKSYDIEGNVSRLGHYLCNVSGSCSSFDYFILDWLDMYQRQRPISNCSKRDNANEWLASQSLEQFYTQLEDNIQKMQSQMIHTLASLHTIHMTRKLLHRQNSQREDVASNYVPKLVEHLDIKRKGRRYLEEHVTQLAVDNIRLQVRQKVWSFLEESYKKMTTIRKSYQQQLVYKRVQTHSLQLILRIASTRKHLLEDIQSHFKQLCQCLETSTNRMIDLECHPNPCKDIPIMDRIEKLYQNTIYRIAKVTGQPMFSIEDILPFVRKCREELHSVKYTEENVRKQSYIQMQELQKQMKQLVEMLQYSYLWESDQKYSQRINLMETSCIQQDVNDILTTYEEERKLQRSCPAIK